MSTAFLPGQGDTLRRSRLRKHFRDIADRHSRRLVETMEDIADGTVAYLREITPKDTGAAAGTTVGARRLLYPKHPASLQGLTIGNAVGQSGWQVVHANNSNKISIINPMWEPYLKAVNYTGANGGFVEEAVRELRVRLRNLKA